VTESRPRKSGVLPAEEIAHLIDQGAVALGAEFGGALQPRQLQPASLDLTVGKRAWRVRASFLPRGRSATARLDDGLLMHELDLTRPAILERGCVYVVELAERLKLPKDVSGAANPKSSTGRIDVFVRLVVDGGASFDAVPAGYEGPLYAEISPRTFSIVIRPGSSLNQLRFKRGDCRLNDEELRALHAQNPLIDSSADIQGGIGLCVRLCGALDEIVGWRGRRHAALIDIDQKGALTPEDYFEPLLAPKSGFIILDPDEFYILASAQALSVPPDYAAEMTPIDPGLGEFRVHYAGFFDPGFGWSGGKGSRAVLEVRSHDAPFVLEDGQLVARLAYERMAARPKRLYGEDLRSHYQGQGLKLSKHFR
jgi:dCTP deaminase